MVPAVGDLGGYNQMWNNIFSTTEGITSRLDAVKALGANAIVVASPQFFSPPNDVEARISFYAAEIRKRGLRVCPTLSQDTKYPTGQPLFGSTTAQNASNFAPIFQQTQMLYKHMGDLFMCADVSNEAQGVSLANISWLVSAMRPVLPGVPLSFSVYLLDRQKTLPLAQMQAQAGCDYHNLHPYFGGQDTTTLSLGLAPKPADFTDLEAASFFLGSYFIGECGVQNVNSAAVTSDWVTGLGQISARRKCLGAVQFSDVNFDDPGKGSQPFGMAGNPGMMAAFKGWPGGQI